MMSLPKMPGTLAGLAMGAVVAAGGAMPAVGDVVYEVPLDITKVGPESGYPDNSFTQLVGNGASRYGDNVRLGDNAGRRLQSIVLPMVLASYLDDTGDQYEATVRMQIYAVDSNGIPTGPALGFKDVTHTFTNFNYVTDAGGTSRPGVYAATEYITFDFDSQNLHLPQEFAFVFDDITPSGSEGTLQNAFSFWHETLNSIDTFGSTQSTGLDTPRRILEEFVTINGPEWQLVAREITNSSDREYNTVVQINAIPEPASMALLGAGGLMLLRRKRA